MPRPVNVGLCPRCGRKLALQEGGLCMDCTIAFLQEKLLERDVQLEASMRRQKALYEEISALRRKLMGV